LQMRDLSWCETTSGHPNVVSLHEASFLRVLAGCLEPGGTKVPKGAWGACLNSIGEAGLCWILKGNYRCHKGSAQFEGNPT
jgi:hypothetical protein